jgi:hypothetical protein
MFYLHIPKTGGQTLARRLASAFPPPAARICKSDNSPIPPITRTCRNAS